MASKINKGEILAKFFDDGEYTALFADGAVSAACGYAAGQQAYAVYQNGEAVTVKDVEKNIKVLEMAAQTGCPVVTFYNSVGAKLAEGLDVLTATAKLNAAIAKVSGVVPQVAVVTGVCGGTSALNAASADVCVMAKDAELFFTAPFTSAAKGDKVADAGSAEAAAKAGVAAIVAESAAEAAEKAAHIVGLLPANNLTGPAIFEFEQPTAVLAAGAAPEKAAAALIDKDSAVELFAGFGKSVYTAFATIGGNAVADIIIFGRVAGQQAGAYAKGGEIFILDMGKPVRIDDLAKNLIRLSGYTLGVDMQIRYTGLRPGEKLYEEMLMKEEGMQDTANKMIHIGRPIRFDQEHFEERLVKLKEAAYDEVGDIRPLLHELAPTYHPERGGESAVNEAAKLELARKREAEEKAAEENASRAAKEAEREAEESGQSSEREGER